jgi:phosphoesterase RecJ-like protein
MGILEKSDIYQSVKRFFDRYDNYVILGHYEPDGDCAGAQLVLESWLGRKGKNAVVVSAGPFNRPEVAPLRSRFKDSIGSEEVTANAARILVDCSEPDRTRISSDDLKKLPCLVIDHHVSAVRYGDINIIDPSSPSTTLLILDLMESLGEKPNREEAELLLFGFCTDTGFFRHLDEKSSEAIRSVSRLVGYGASLRRVYHSIYGGRELNQFKLLGKLLERTESYADGKVLLTWQTLEDRGNDEGNIRGSDDLYKNLQSVRGNELVIFIKQENDRECSVGLRSTGSVNVAELAQSLGGGGHRLAAGCTVRGSIEKVRSDILECLKERYDIQS